MKVGLLSSQDWANLQWGLTKALRAVGVEPVSYKLGRHLFGYEEQCEVITVPNIREEFKDCDVVLVCHSDFELLEYLPENAIKINVATGTKFRQGFEHINKAFEKAPFELIDSSEFQKHCKNPKYIIKPFETNLSKPIGDRIVVGHFPSNPSVKGTEDINRIIWQLKDSYDFEFVISNERVSHEENLQRINSCDIYVELLAPTQGGKPYGSFGVTAIEAAAMGKIVITQSIEDNGLYGSTYGPCMLNFVRDEQGLKKTLGELLQYKGSHIKGQGETTREWAIRNHSYEATGKLLMKYLNGI